MELKYKFQ